MKETKQSEPAPVENTDKGTLVPPKAPKLADAPLHESYGKTGKHEKATPEAVSDEPSRAKASDRR